MTPEEIEAAKNPAQQQVSHSVFDTQPNAQSMATIPAEEAAVQKTPEELEAEKNQSLFSEGLFKEDAAKTAAAQNQVLDADTIAKLQAAGYEVKKAEIVDQDAQIKEKLDFHQKNIDDAKVFIARDDKYIVTEKLKNDKADTYANTGRQHLINSEEFNIEIEAEMEANYENPALLKMYADNLRGAIKNNVIDKNDTERKKIVSEVETTKTKEIEQKQLQLDGSFDKIFKDGYLGLTFEKQDVIDARNNVISGKFSDEIKNNPEILAKLALVYYQEQKLIDKVGQPTYGEGMAAAYHALNGSDKTNSKTSPATVAQNMGTAGQGTFQVNKWLNLANEDEVKDKKVI